MLENTPWGILGILATVILLLVKEHVAKKNHAKCDDELASSINSAIALTRLEGKIEVLSLSLGKLDETVKRIDAENTGFRHELRDKMHTRLAQLDVEVATLRERVNMHHNSESV